MSPSRLATTLHLRLRLPVLLLLALAPAAHAQINSPPPALMGQPSFHLYSVPGAIRNGGLGTFFSCTNVTSATIRVGVEVFGPPGGAGINDPSASSLDIAEGGTRMFGSAATGISIDSDLAAGSYSKGSARILATQRKGILCSAFVADLTTAPVASMMKLTIVKKTKQKGE